MHILSWNKVKSLTINLHHVLSTATMDDPEVFTKLLMITLGVTTQQTIDVMTNFTEAFGDLLDLNDGDIEKFVKDNHSENNSR